MKPECKIHLHDPEVKCGSLCCIEGCQDRFQGLAFVNTVMDSRVQYVQNTIVSQLSS